MPKQDRHNQADIGSADQFEQVIGELSPIDAIALLNLLLHRLPGQRGATAAGRRRGGGDTGAAQGDDENEVDASGADSSQAAGGAGGSGVAESAIAAWPDEHLAV